jgi:hypothetical protein
MKILSAILLLSLTFIAMPAYTHHSHASLDLDKSRLMQGVVTKYEWRSPHIYLRANVLQENGSVKEYFMELHNPMAMARAGWDKNTFKTGDRIIWEGPPDKDPNRGYMGLTWIEKQGQDRLYVSARAQADYLKSAGKELPEQLRSDREIKPAMNIGEGNWTRTGPGNTRFKNIYGPELAMDWPLTSKARKAVDNYTEEENPIVNCHFGGPPRNIWSLSTWKWTRPDAKTIVIDRDLWPEPRVIHLDKTAKPGEPSTQGHSIGWFEGDELVIKTNHFKDDAWGLYWGIDSSDKKELMERYRLSADGLMLHVEFTFSDPEYLTESLTRTHQWAKVADKELVKAPCSLDNAKYFISAGYE